MGDDIPRTRRADAEASGAEPAEVPAGGRGADTGAAPSTRIDETDVAPVQGISSQNDIAGVGTRAADGSIEHSDIGTVPSQRRRTAEDSAERSEGLAPAQPTGASAGAHSGGGQHSATEGAAEPAPSLAQDYEPGVDPAHARDSRAVGPDASDGDPGSAKDRPENRMDRVAHRTGSRAGIVVGGVVGLVAVVLFAFAVPVAPAIAWIGIALEVALFAVLAVSGGMLREGRYRRLSITVLTIAMIAVAVVFGILLLTVGLAR
jgi:hypothetical protein